MVPNFFFKSHVGNEKSVLKIKPHSQKLNKLFSPNLTYFLKVFTSQLRWCVLFIVQIDLRYMIKTIN